MEKITDYKALYSLQDKVLNIVGRCDNSFYLTGGTCLHRFLVSPRRYSDDLDFFCSDPGLFRDDAREAVSVLRKSDLDVVTEVDTRDFIRIKINNALKTDFVCDRVYRYGRPEQRPEGFRIDNIMNILGNKISAVTGRDEPKDVFDITVIRDTAPLDWNLALDIAGKKCSLEKDYLIYRLQSFPPDLLDYLALVKDGYRGSCKKTLSVILEELENLQS
ncbi:MAG: nucleotidyl transferase AbiEii/AbiGii toxin family protein [Spirochaetales bacterium]|nr:nucleotidyl transferase AbiEii/AbiGii toxin family protein [Spirochaetales bacterium]